ncbi:MAG: RidA family protein [Geminicoccaceae bacterium]|nr:RidA family protein [Geminicoccaceae bacterium]
MTTDHRGDAGAGAGAGAGRAVPVIVHPPELPDPAPHGYATSVVAPRGARLAFVSGQGGQDEEGRLSEDFATQVRQAYANLCRVLEALGAEPGRVVKLTVYVVDHNSSKLGVLTENVKRTFGDTLPAQTLVPVPRLAIDPMLFEVDAIVALE